MRAALANPLNLSALAAADVSDFKGSGDFYHPSVHVLLLTARLPRNESEAGSSPLVSGSTLLAEEANQNKTKGSHKQKVRSSCVQSESTMQSSQLVSYVASYGYRSMCFLTSGQQHVAPSLTCCPLLWRAAMRGSLRGEAIAWSRAVGQH